MAIFRPRCVHVRIASGCNLGCTMCERELLPLSHGGKKLSSIIQFVDGREDLSLLKDMSLSTWERVREVFFPHFDRIELGGLGETTLGKIFTRAASDIVAANKQLFFFTNGHFLGKDHVLSSVGDTPHISVSFDAGTAEVYERVRKGNFEEAVEGVRAFRKAKPGAKIDSQFTATTDNIDDLPAWVSLCAELGIGRTENGEQLLLTAADHHVTDRVSKSVRFARDKTVAAVEASRLIAQAEGLWFISTVWRFSDLSPNGAFDGSDPSGVRRFGDLMLGAGPQQFPCIYEDPGNSGLGDPLPSVQAVTAPREVYVDYDGKVWSCLGRHVVGDALTQSFEELIDDNEWYQEFLRNWFTGQTQKNVSTCLPCPRRK